MTRHVLLAALAICCAHSTDIVNAQPNTPSTSTAALPQRMATVDALLLVDLVLDSEPIKTERQNKGKEFDETFRVAQKELMDLEARLLMGAKEDPLREGLIKDWEGKKKNLNELQASLSSDFDRFNSHKAAQAWVVVTAKVDELAAKHGFTHVITTRRERSFIADTQAGTVQQLLSRPIIVYPAADDLTDRAIEAMNLKVQYDAKLAEEARRAAEAAAAAKAAASPPSPLSPPTAAPVPPAGDTKKPGESNIPKPAPGLPLPADQPK